MLDGLEKLAHAVLSIGIMLISIVVLWVGYRAGMAVITPDAGPVTNMGIWYLAVGATMAVLFGIVSLCYGYWSLTTRERWLAFARDAHDASRHGDKSNWRRVGKQNYRHAFWGLIYSVWALAGVVNLALAENDEEVIGNALDPLWLDGKSAMHLGVILLVVTALQIGGLTWLRDQALDRLVFPHLRPEHLT